MKWSRGDAVVLREPLCAAAQRFRSIDVEHAHTAEWILKNSSGVTVRTAIRILAFRLSRPPDELPHFGNVAALVFHFSALNFSAVIPLSVERI